MTDLRQAAQQALEFLMTRRMGAEAVIESLNEALAQPEQEPVAWYHDDFDTLELSRVQRVGWKPLYTTPPAAQPEQEPVAWMYTRLKDGSSIKLVEKRAEMPEGGWGLYKEEPLYTTPPAAQRQWVGLTDEDMKDPQTHILDFIYGARWAEAKLKERNT